MIIAEVAGGGSLVSDVVSSFQYDTNMNLFNLAAYANMRSSFHGREAQRYYDFLIYRYLLNYDEKLWFNPRKRLENDISLS